MHSPASWLLGPVDVVILASCLLSAVMLMRDPSLRLSGLTLRQRIAVRFGRHRRLYTAQVACVAVGLLLLIAYGVTFLA